METLPVTLKFLVGQVLLVEKKKLLLEKNLVETFRYNYSLLNLFHTGKKIGKYLISVEPLIPLNITLCLTVLRF